MLNSHDNECVRSSPCWSFHCDHWWPCMCCTYWYKEMDLKEQLCSTMWWFPDVFPGHRLELHTIAVLFHWQDACSHTKCKILWYEYSQFTQISCYTHSDILMRLQKLADFGCMPYVSPSSWMTMWPSSHESVLLSGVSACLSCSQHNEHGNLSLLLAKSEVGGWLKIRRLHTVNVFSTDSYQFQNYWHLLPWWLISPFLWHIVTILCNLEIKLCWNLLNARIFY